MTTLHAVAAGARAHPGMAITIIVAGYLAAIGVGLASVFLLGLWSLGIPLLLLVVLAGSGTAIRAAALLLLMLPFLVSYLESSPAWAVVPGHVAAGVAVLAWYRERRCDPARAAVPRPYLVAYGAFIGAIWLSYAVGDWRDSIRGAFAQTQALGAASRFTIASLASLLLVPACSDRHRVRALMWIVLASGAIPTLSLLLDTGPADDPTALFERSPGWFAHGVHTAGVFELLYVLTSIGLLATEGNPARRRWLWATTAGFLVALLLTGSRTTLVTLLGVGIVGLFTIGRAVWRRIELVHVYAVSTALCVALLIGASIVKITPGGGVYSIFVTSRWALMRFGFALFGQHPLNGVGFGVHDLYLAAQPSVSQFGLNIHTYYVTILTETGLIGFGAFVAVIGLLLLSFTRAFTIFRARGDREMEIVTSTFFLAFIGILIMFLTQAGIGVRLFWVLAAVALGLRGMAARAPDTTARAG